MYIQMRLNTDTEEIFSTIGADIEYRNTSVTYENRGSDSWDEITIDGSPISMCEPTKQDLINYVTIKIFGQ